jgi:hypothetical protein
MMIGSPWVQQGTAVSQEKKASLDAIDTMGSMELSTEA